MSGDRISRRDFLKLFGSGATVFLLGWFFGGSSNSFLNNYRKDNISNGAQLAYAQTSGGWLPVQSSTSTVAIHIALTPAGKIFYLSGSAWDLNKRNGPYEARLLDPVTGSESSVPLSKDLFCAGQCQLPDGNILLCGGTALYENDINNCNGRWHGARYAYEFDVNTGSLVQQAQMNAGRWYPTLVTLPDGKVLVVSGFDEYGSYNYLAEVYNPSTKSWSINYDPFRTNTYCVGYDSGCPGAGSPCFGGLNQSTAPWLALYPRMILMPSGLIYTSSMREQIFLLDPSNGRWTALGLTSYGLFREYGASILLPLQNSSSERGKVMVVGGSPDNTSPATNIVEIHDFNQGSSTSPNIRTVASLNTRRKYVLPIILPNGKVMVFGGSTQNNNNPVYVPETFDPENENQGWANGPAATVPRMYHGAALLLQDGSVWTAGGTPGPGLQENRIEIFRPSYFFSGTRPTISGAPTIGAYGASITIPTPDAANVARVSLVKTGCTTHHYDTDMRLIWLPITSRGANSVTVSAPINANIAPPGYYMIHVLYGSLVPSTAKIIKIPGTGTGTGDTTPPAQVANLNVTPVSSTQLNLSWNANTEPDLQRYNVYRGTTAGFPVTLGTTTPLAQPTTNSFSDTGLTASTTYYYKVSAVDTSGNIGPLSTESSGTTNPPPDTTPPAQVANLNVTPVSSTQLNLSWNANTEPDLQRYNVYRGTTAGFPVTLGTTTPLAQPTTNSFSDTGLTASTTYYYKVSAVDTSGNIGPLSTESSGTTTNPPPDTTPPAQVANLNVTPVSSTQLNLSWNANTEPDLQRYNVYRGTTAGFPVTLGTTTPLAQPTTNSFSDTGLTASTTYYYKVSAVDTSGNIGPLSTEGSGTTNPPPDTTPPAQVANLNVTPVSSTQLNLSWNANTEPDLQRYNVYRGTTVGFPVNTATDTPLAQVTAPATTYSNTGLTASTTYYYKVSAVDTSGNIGPLSSERSGTTLASSPVFYNVGPPGNSTETLRSGNITRSGEEPANSNSIIVGKSIKTLNVRLKKKGNPSGPISARIRRKTGDSIVASFNETVQSNNLSTSFTDYVFTLSNAYIITSDDRILIEYSGQNGVDIEVWSTEKFDGANTRKVSYNNGYTFASTADIVGSMSS